jgi:hypothetical protein
MGNDVGYIPNRKRLVLGSACNLGACLLIDCVDIEGSSHWIFLTELLNFFSFTCYGSGYQH